MKLSTQFLQKLYPQWRSHCNGWSWSVENIGSKHIGQFSHLAHSPIFFVVFSWNGKGAAKDDNCSNNTNNTNDTRATTKQWKVGRQSSLLFCSGPKQTNPRLFTSQSTCCVVVLCCLLACTVRQATSYCDPRTKKKSQRAAPWKKKRTRRPKLPSSKLLRWKMLQWARLTRDPEWNIYKLYTKTNISFICESCISPT